MNKIENKKGFTIIEVVLVLAIAALLILMVFLAWPALQRSQKDQARKDDVGALGTIIGTWRSDHRGVSPEVGELRDAAEKRGLNRYTPDDKGIVSASLTGSSTELDAVNKEEGNNTTPAFNKIPLDKVIYVKGARCTFEGGKAKLQKASARTAALAYAVEGSGNTPAAQCLDA